MQASDRLPDASDVSRLRGRGRKRPQAEQPPLELSMRNVKWLCKSQTNQWVLRMNFRNAHGELKSRSIMPQIVEDRVYG